MLLGRPGVAASFSAAGAWGEEKAAFLGLASPKGSLTSFAFPRGGAAESPGVPGERSPVPAGLRDVPLSSACYLAPPHTVSVAHGEEGNLSPFPFTLPRRRASVGGASLPPAVMVDRWPLSW